MRHKIGSMVAPSHRTMVAFAVIAATGRVTDIEVGSAAERTLFRVMPLGGTAKLFFESPEQYQAWHADRLQVAAAARKLTAAS